MHEVWSLQFNLPLRANDSRLFSPVSSSRVQHGEEHASGG